LLDLKALKRNAPYDRYPGVRNVETRSLPTLTHCFPRNFTFYVPHPIRSIRKKNEPVSGPLLRYEV
jgi:hypothetical protein